VEPTELPEIDVYREVFHVLLGGLTHDSLQRRSGYENEGMNQKREMEPFSSRHLSCWFTVNPAKFFGHIDTC